MFLDLLVSRKSWWLSDRNIYIYTVYAGRPDVGPLLFTVPVRVHLKASSGPTRVSHYENRHFRGKMWRRGKAKMSQIAHPIGQELCFVETQTWICARACWAQTHFDRVLPLQNRVLVGSHCAGILHMYQFENICVFIQKCLLSAFC